MKYEDDTITNDIIDTLDGKQGRSGQQNLTKQDADEVIDHDPPQKKCDLLRKKSRKKELTFLFQPNCDFTLFHATSGIAPGPNPNPVADLEDEIRTTMEAKLIRAFPRM